MKMVKSLILGSAAGLIAMSGAQAADLPVKAKAVEYVRICSLYGAGFFYIPGTDTCIKLGGYLRVDLVGNSNSDAVNQANGVAGTAGRYRNYYTARSREDLNIDTRTATEYGVVRTFFDATFSWTSGSVAPGGTACCFLLRRLYGFCASRAEIRSASTTPSSSSPGLRWVRRSPSSAHPGPTIRPTPSTALSAAAATSPASIS